VKELCKIHYEDWLQTLWYDMKTKGNENIFIWPNIFISKLVHTIKNISLPIPYLLHIYFHFYLSNLPNFSHSSYHPKLSNPNSSTPIFHFIYFLNSFIFFLFDSGKFTKLLIFLFSFQMSYQINQGGAETCFGALFINTKHFMIIKIWAIFGFRILLQAQSTILNDCWWATW